MLLHKRGKMWGPPTAKAHVHVGYHHCNKYHFNYITSKNTQPIKPQYSFIYNTDVLNLKEYPPKQTTILLALTKMMNIHLTYQKDKLICFANDSILSIRIHMYQENLINWYDTDKKITVRYWPYPELAAFMHYRNTLDYWHSKWKFNVKFDNSQLWEVIFFTSPNTSLLHTLQMLHFDNIMYTQSPSH